MLLKAKEIWAWILLIIEEFSLAFWKPITWILCFFGIWIFDPFGGWADFMAYPLALLFFGGLVYFLLQVRIHFPSSHIVKRRIETDSNIKHRPLDKDIAVDSIENSALWARSRTELKQSLCRLKWARPRGILATQDPYALRLFAVLLFLSGVLTNGSLWLARVHDGAFPFLPSWEKRAHVPALTLWITPPDYTGAQQIIFYAGDEADQPLSIPAFSHIKAVIRGGFGVPRVVISNAEHNTLTRDFEKLDDRQHSLEFEFSEEIKGTQTLSIQQSILTKFKQDIVVIDDLPPEIFERGVPQNTAGATLQFPLTVLDDYGTDSLIMHMDLDPAIDRKPLGKSLSETRIIISPPAESLDIQPGYDLSHHVWAGLPVRFSFEIKDSRGQSAFLGPIYHTLPERHFRHPVAQQLIAFRKRLIHSPYTEIKKLAQEIEYILMRPDSFQRDFITTLALRSAASRLYYAPPYYEDVQLATVKSVIKLLWDTALRIEDGDFSIAARNLKNIRQELQEALQNPNTTEAEKARLMQELKQAMAEYFRELQKEMQKRMAETEHMMMRAPLLSPEEMENMLSSDSLQEFLEQMEAQIMNGDISDAQQMLSQLENLMQMMNPNAMQEMPQDMHMMQEGIDTLQALIDRQQDLLDQTTEQDAEIQRNVEKTMRELYKKPEERSIFPPIHSGEKQQIQNNIQSDLQTLSVDVSSKVGSVPQGISNAGEEMQQSGEKLRLNTPGASIPHQQQAIEDLSDAQDSLSEQLSERMQQMLSFSMSSSGDRSYAPGGRDPLGRPYDPDGNHGEDHDSDVEVPDEIDRRHVQEIQKILRERSGEYDRPESEREYYRRLLKKF